MENATTRDGANGRKTPLALIAAGGEGKRLGSIGPKALVFCAGKPLLAWCLDAFARSPAFGAGAEDARAIGLKVLITEGGPSRSHSVAAALRAGQPESAEIVLVHDA